MVVMSRLIALLWIWGICLFGGSAQATTINYTAVDLANTLPGQDLWQYRYTVNGSFVAFGGFDVFFDASLYTLLQDPAPAVNSDWSVVITPPDAGLGTSGLYTATALSGTPSLANAFTLNFVWLGAGRPDSQTFDVFDDNFLTVEQGSTTLPRENTPVPEPTSLLLVACGLLLLRFLRKSKSIERGIA
jgi:hypothetical protein